MSLWIIIPGLNEEQHIKELVLATRSQGYENIIFVDDGSKDASSEVAQNAGAIVLRHQVNLGKGCATRTGIEYAISKGAKIIILMDADGQHRPEDIKRFVNEIKTKKADIVFGYRTLDENMPFLMKLGNWFINQASHIVNGINLKDTQSGFRCFKTTVYEKIKWTSSDYSMESEMIANVAKNKIKYSQIPIRTIYLDRFKGTTVIDGIKIFINILKFKFLGGKK